MKRSRLILGTLISLIALSSVGVGTSLAWYASATKVEVTSLIVELNGDQKLLLGVDEDVSKYKESLDNNDLAKVSAFYPVSTMFHDQWLEAGRSPEYYEYGGLTHVDGDTGEPDMPKSVSRGYLNQTLYLYSDSNVYVSIDPTDCFIRAYEQSNAVTAHNHPHVGFTEEEVTQRLNSLEKAMRFSLYNPSTKDFVIIDPHKEGPTYYAGPLDNSMSGTYDSYSSSDGNKYEIVYGQVEDRSKILYGKSSDSLVPGNGELTAFNAGHDALVKPFDLAASLEAGYSPVEEDSYELSDAFGSMVLEENPFVIAVKAFTPTPVTIGLYLEGWDLDCVNANMGGSFLAKLQFKILRDMPL